MATRKGSDNIFPLVRLSYEDDTPATPASGQGHLVAGVDKVLRWIDSDGTLTVLGSAIVDYGEDADIVDQDYDDVADAGVLDEVARADHRHGMPPEPAPGGGGAADPVFELFGTPATAFEFDTSSLSGLTAFGTIDTEDADTTVPGSLYLEDNASSAAWCGRYLASPSMPFTAVTKILDLNLHTNFNACGLIVGAASMGGAFMMAGAVYNSARTVAWNRYTNLTTFNTSASGGGSFQQAPLYVAIIANSSTDLHGLYSFNGYVWRTMQASYNPSLTVGAVGVGMASESSVGMGVAYDYLRIFNGALTFPGAA